MGEALLQLEHRPERREADPQSVPGAVDLDYGIQLRGSIDLVERRPAGQVRVTDHKTGKAEGKRGQLIDGGKSLQPLLYALAAEKLFAGEAVASGRLYFCTSTGAACSTRSWTSWPSSGGWRPRVRGA